MNTKTAAYADWNSIKTLLQLPSDRATWDKVQLPSSSISYLVPRGFTVSRGDQEPYQQVVGSDRDTYMKHLTAKLEANGSYGGFSGTLESSFGLTEDTTEAYSFGTQTNLIELYTLSLPENLDEFLDPKFKEDLYNIGMSPNDFYENYGTHYTSSILMGGKCSSSFYSQFKSEYSESTFEVDLSAAYEELVAKFKVSGSFSYDYTFAEIHPEIQILG